ncbi:hypothetical protein F9Y90_00990 [Borrelia miyamotoi]|uniref:Uncharacterized protein n=1 Tax=Borrelia miyamotoi TaxID=47466 RepID=A0AAX3JLD0_9SPIR|nr:hypothetical protein [Borrelia miyamotoi]QFP41716.1 hypothetical protein F9Y90_00990 [Borrelia miyamotoi]QFP47836.1 hypothetical protein F9Y91_00985 [Borrelia miyamotoi]QGT55596.1 hypothetical protein GNY89_00995 [Borrelia miyamotoi]QGT56380.1 hypothetical protein GNY88_00995 [Borrelia miyamotoi]WAZ71626.1 hypothetical protein O5404_00995 [Borrelia miyamotoi]
MKFFDFGSLGFYRFFDFQKHLNFSIFRYGLINYYSYKEQSTLINDANLLKGKIVFLDKAHQDIAKISSSTYSKINESLNVNRKIFCDVLITIKGLIKKYYPESEFLDLECDLLLNDEDTFNKILDKLRYLNFRVDLKKKIEEFDIKSKTPYACIKIATFFIKEEFLERLANSIDFFSNEANNNSLDLINKEIGDYYERVEKVKVSKNIKDTHKKFVIEYAKEKISKIMREHSLDVSKLLIKISLLDITIQCFESYYLNLLEALNILFSINNIIEIGLDELPDAIFNDWNELVYLRRRDFQKLVLISDYVFQKRIISVINSGGWKFTFFSLSPRQGDIIQFAIDINKNFNNIEDGIKEYELKINRFNDLKLDWEKNLKNFDHLFI